MESLYEGLKQGLQEVVDHLDGKITLKTETHEIPDAPPRYAADDVKRIRKKFNCSQGIFAKVLNVSPKTIQSWELGTRVPSHAALRLLEIVDRGVPTFLRR